MLLTNSRSNAQWTSADIYFSGFSETAQYTDVINGNCTSCAVTQDKSAYWHPALYFRHDNGSYELVPQTGGMLA